MNIVNNEMKNTKIVVVDGSRLASRRVCDEAGAW